MELQEALYKYESTVQRLSRMYYGLFVRGMQDYDLDLEDLEQVGRMAIVNINSRRPEMLETFPYVMVAIRNAIFGEMRKMRHKVKQVYLVREHEELIQVVDVLPTQDKGSKKLSDPEELLYYIKHEFSAEEAKALEALLEKCENIYDLNLSEPPATDLKDRVRVVTRLDLNDEEMIVYAEVLLGARKRFPPGFTFGDQGRSRAIKYAHKFLDALGISPKEFLHRHDKLKMIRKYRLDNFYRHAYDWSMLDFMRELDNSLTSEDMVLSANTPLSQSEVEEVINGYEKYEGKVSRAAEALGHDPITITKYWRQHGFPIRQQRVHSLAPGKVQEILDSYNECQGNALEAERRTGYCDSTIAKYWRNAGLEVKGHSTVITSEEVDTIVSSFDEFQGRHCRAAKALGYDPVTIKKYWEAHGLEPKGKRGKKKVITPDKVSEIVSSFDKFQGMHCLAAKALGYDRATIKKYWNRAGLTKNGKRNIG